MRRLALLIALGAACHNSARPGGAGGSGVTGAAEPRGALDGFLSAVRAQDLQAMSRLWGGEKGLARDRLSRDELEKRELLIMCHMQHDSYKVVAEHPNQNGRQVFLVRLNRGREFRETSFTMFHSGSDRWYVEEADMTPVGDFCRQMPPR